MNPDKPHAGTSSESFKNNLVLSAQLLAAEHQADDTVMYQLRGPLEAEGLITQYEPLLDEAYDIHLEMEQALASLTSADSGKAFTDVEAELLEKIREKNKTYCEIKDKIIAVLTNLGYELEDEAVEPSEVSVQAESESAKESPIEKLTNLYRNADSGVFVDKVVDGRVYRKKSEVIYGEILRVLQSAGFDHDQIKIFMNETFKSIRREIRNNIEKQSSTRDRNEREVIAAELGSKYQELSDKVAAFMREEKVGKVENKTEAEESAEVGGNIEQAIESALQEFELFKQSGTYTKDAAFIKAEAAVEGLAQFDEKDAVVAANKKATYLRVLTKALAGLRAQSESIALDETPAPTEADTSPEPEVAAEPEVEAGESKEVTPEAIEFSGAEVGSKETEAATEGKPKKNFEAHFEAKKGYREKQQAYKQALADFYEEQKSKATIQSQIGAGLKKITGLGLNPELPPALLAMQNEYKELRAVYAKSLDAALTERQNRPGHFEVVGESDHLLVEKRNNSYSLDTDKAKIAFGKKFILKPNQEIAALQETAVLSPEVKARLVRTMELMSKHKWAMRIGIITAAGIAGGLSGGVGLILAGAKFQALSTALSAGAGALSGLGANRLTQRGVDKASAAFDTKSKEFTLEDLDAFETELLKAQSSVKSAKTKQKVATIGAAVIAGGATGYGLGSVDFNSPPPVTNEGLSQGAVERIVASEIEAAEANQPTVPTAEQTEAVVEQNVEVTPEKIDGIKMERFTIPFYGNSGERLFETVVPEIKIEGSFTAGELPAEAKLALEKHIKLSMDDALHAHPYIPEEKLEAEVLAKVQAKFSAAPWYAEAGITKIDIKDMSLEEYFVGAGAPSLEISEQPIAGGNRVEVGIGSGDSVYTEASPGSEAVASAETGSGTYVVQKGDTLFEITEKRFAEQLKDIPADKRTALLDELFKNIQADNDLHGSLGMRSGDVDLIYPNEKLNLDGVEAELSRLVERQQVLESFRTSGPLSVEADAPAKEVLINVVENPIPVPPPMPDSVEVVADSGRVYTEAVPTAVENPEVLVAPRPYALNGQYAEHPDYKAFIDNSFESRKEFERIVEKSATNFDNATYDVFERSTFFGGAQFESPYRFMGEKSLEDLSEFQSQSNEQIRAFLKDNDMKYETYLAWLDLVDEMKKALPNQPSTTVADLFQRYVAETLVPGANPLIKKS